MNRLRLLVFTILFGIIGGCGFHLVQKNMAINAEIIANEDSIFANKLKKKLNENISHRLKVHVLKERKSEDISSYSATGSQTGSNLIYTVDLNILDLQGQILSKETLSANMLVRKLSSPQAERIQIDETYEKLADSIVRKLIRKLMRFNENKL